MSDYILIKTARGALIPADQQTAERVAKLKCGQALTGDFKRMTPNNYRFHCKLFALTQLAFDHWEPVERTHKGQVIAKNFDQFREDLTILAGFYETEIRIDGSLRFNAKSWAFANMEDEEKDRLYNSIINVVLAKILTNYTRDDLDAVVDQVLAFA